MVRHGIFVTSLDDAIGSWLTFVSVGTGSILTVVGVDRFLRTREKLQVTVLSNGVTNGGQIAVYQLFY